MSTRRAQAGSVSSGTLSSDDLIKAFTRELERLTDWHRTDAQALLIADAHEMMARMDDGNWKDDEVFCEDVEFILDERLIPALEEFAPEGHYFGGSEGDGANFGFWPETDWNYHQR